MRVIELGVDKTFPIVDPTSGTYIVKLATPYQYHTYFLIEFSNTEGYRAIEIRYDPVANANSVTLSPYNRSDYKENMQNVLRYLENHFINRDLSILHFEQSLQEQGLQEFCKYVNKYARNLNMSVLP